MHNNRNNCETVIIPQTIIIPYYSLSTERYDQVFSIVWSLISK